MPSLFLEFGVREGNWSQEPSFYQWVSCRAGFDRGDPPRHLSKPRLECSRWPITSVSLLRPHCKQAALPPAGWKGPAKASTTWVPAPAPALQCLDLLHLHLVASSYLCRTFPSQGVLFSLSFELSFDTLMYHPCLHFCLQIEWLVQNDCLPSRRVKSFHGLLTEWLMTNTCKQKKCAVRSLEDFFFSVRPV